MQLLERRLKVATEKEKEEFGAALKLQYMSEDEDTAGGDGWRHLQLTWRTEVTQFFRKLDNRANRMKKDNLKERTKRTCTGISKKRAPKDAPTWALKPTSRNEIPHPACSTRTPGGGVRTCGGGSGRGAETESRSSARRAITYSADDVVNSLTE